MLHEKIHITNSDCGIDINDLSLWKNYTRKSYEVLIQMADVNQVYNVPDKPGYVYNFLEKYETYVKGYDYVVTGLLGEMWPIRTGALDGYDVDNISSISCTPKKIKTKVIGNTYYGICIPVGYEFSVSLSKETIMHGNAPGVEHLSGDYIICSSFENGDYRIINGSIFDKMYEVKKSR
ncbi:MAG: hypothetical protein Q4D29_04515 [Lachnospiraceae bacterium]|nr:hypothetical protein [Lachnospiraceae bacterium]